MAQAEEKYVIDLRRYLPKKVPSFTFTFITSILLIILFSYITSLDFIKALLLFALPYVVITFLDYFFVRISRVYFPIKRISYLNILAFAFALLLFVIFRIFFSFFFSFFLGFASLVYLRHIVYRVFFHNRKLLAPWIGSLYNIIYILISLFFFPAYFVPYLLSTLVYLALAEFALHFSIIHFIREFGEDPLWFLSSFINYLGRQDGDEVNQLNGFFKSIYRPREVPVTLLGFHRKDRSLKCLFVFPYIHPGPFGDVGGSNIPNKLEKHTGLSNLMVFHTTTTHDDNIATEEDVKKIAEIVKNYDGGGKYDKMSDFHRFRVENIDIAAQIFGKYALLFLIPTGELFDDVDFSAGMSLRRKLNSSMEEVMVVDAHNNFDVNALPLTLHAHHINNIKRELRGMEADAPIIMGCAMRKVEGKSIGPGGIRVAVFKYKDKKIAYILLDGNNVKKGLRDRTRERVIGIVDEAEIFSTDNHIVNYNFLDLNPVGERDPWEPLLDEIEAAVKDALQNMESVSVEASTKHVMLHMATRGQLHRLTEMTRLGVGRAKLVAPVTLLLSIFFSLLLFHFLMGI